MWKSFKFPIVVNYKLPSDIRFKLAMFTGSDNSVLWNSNWTCFNLSVRHKVRDRDRYLNFG